MWHHDGEEDDDPDTQSTTLQKLVHHTWITGHRFTDHPKQSTATMGDEHGLLADDPSAFRQSHAFVPCRIIRKRQTPYQMSNRGLGINLPLIHLRETNMFLALLECRREISWNDRFCEKLFLGIFLKKTNTASNQYARVRCNKLREDISPEDCSRTDLFVSQAVINPLSGGPTHHMFLRSLPRGSHVVTQVVHFKFLPDGGLKPRQIYEQEASQPEPAQLPSVVLQLADTQQEIPEQPTAAIVLARRSDQKQLLVLIGVTSQFRLGFTVVAVDSEKTIDVMTLPATYYQSTRFEPTLNGSTDDGDHICAATHTSARPGRNIIAVDFTVWFCDFSCPTHKAT
jgi:hypothetical protein